MDLDSTDLCSLMAAKRFLGQEFLTWLWYKSDRGDGVVHLASQGEVGLRFVHHLLLEYGEGEFQEKLICRGLKAEMREARAGLLQGKMPEQARLLLSHGEQEWYLTLTGGLLEFRSVGLPRHMVVAASARDDLGAEGDLLVRLDLVREVGALVNALLLEFLTLRVSDGWDREIQAIRGWMAEARRFS